MFDKAAWYSKNRERLNAYSRTYHKKNRESQIAKMRTRSRKLREEIIQKLGGKCACCGEKAYEFLTLDHIQGGGHKHRMACSSSRTTIYWEVKMNGFPKDRYRILCWNCNAAMGIHKRCPHNDVKIEDILKENEG